MPQSRRRKLTWRCATGALPRVCVSSRFATSSFAASMVMPSRKRELIISAVAVIGGVGDDEALRVLARRADHRHVAEAVLVDEIQVALVVRRAAEDRAGAVFHQDEVRDIDRQLPRRIERMQRADAGVEAELLGGVDLGLRRAHVLALVDERRELRIVLRRRLRQRMIRRDRHELRAEQRVRPRRENLQLALAVRASVLRIEREANQQALAAADPVLLHQPDFFRPAVELVERVEQVLRIVADLEEPLRQLALLDQRAGAPAAAVDDLLVGEHGHVDRVPVHLRLLALDQARLSRKSRNIRCWCL